MGTGERRRKAQFAYTAEVAPLLRRQNIGPRETRASNREADPGVFPDPDPTGAAHFLEPTGR